MGKLSFWKLRQSLSGATFEHSVPQLSVRSEKIEQEGEDEKDLYVS